MKKTKQETLTKEEIIEIQQAIEEVKKEKTKPIEQVAKEFGVFLP